MTVEAKSNPLLRMTGIPAFDLVTADHVGPAVDTILAETDSEFARIEKLASNSGTLSWEELLVPLDEMDYKLERVWGPVGHLLAVKNSPEMRTAYEASQPKIVSAGLKISQSLPIFKALKALQADASKWNTLTEAQQRIISKRIQGTELSGVGLVGEPKKRFNEIEQELSKISTTFSNNVLDATKAFELVLTTKDEIVGLPDHVLELTSQAFNQSKKDATTASTPKTGPWKFTLDMPSYIPFMEFSVRRDLREKMYRAYVTRASSGVNDNTAHMHRILELRSEKAKILGFDNFASMSLSTKMAPGVDAVYKLLSELQEPSLKTGRKEMDGLTEFAKKKGCNDAIVDWDVPYWAERMKEEQFDFKEEELIPYFPMPVVLDGLFALCKKVFGITVRASDGEAPVWHKDVRFFTIKNAADADIAAFYLDPYSRPENKRGGAWMNVCVDRRELKNSVVNPIAHLICNGTPPVGKNPSLMSFDQVKTLFHEFGHGLQHMMTTVKFREAAGINNVEWDAVELPSQFMENWLFHAPTLISLTSHVDSGAKLPSHYVDKLIAARTYRAGWASLRQLQFGFIDLELHDKFNPKGKETAFDVHQRIAKKTGVLTPIPENKFLCSFSHIFAGGYAAGYFSYKWAEVLSADAYSAFEEAGLNDEKALKETGHRFRDTVLALGGGKHPMEVFKAFRGREPSTKALLRHSGLI